MKVLFDAIATQNPISKCSTIAQFVTLAEVLLEKTDVFMYFPIPDWVTDEDFADMPQSPRIKYIRVPQSKDRMREYNRISRQLEDMLSFSGGYWDWDVLVTVRSLQVPMMRVHSVSPRQVNRRDWSKKIILIEDMMVISKKPTVPKSNEEVQDRLSIEAYLAADMTLIPAYHQKKWIKDIARTHFSPAKQREMDSRTVEVCHLNLPEFSLKKPEFKYDGKRKFNLAFIGRMERSNARLEIINGVMSNQFIMGGDKVNPVICTVSPEGSPAEVKIDKHVVKILHPKRAEFWRMAKEELDLGVFFHVDVELNMSMLEPITFGMPEIVKKAPWSVGMFGEQYPFYVDNETQAYAMVNEFIKDYDKMYAKFEAWYISWFVPEYTKRIQEEGLYKYLLDLISEKSEEQVKGAEEIGSMKNNAIVKLLVEHGGDEFKILDLIDKLSKTHIKSLAGKTGEEFDKRGLVWSTPWNDFRLTLIHHHGYEDASTELGHLRKVKC